MTLSTGILFTDSDADGTLFELSYADRVEAGVPVYAVQMDAQADEIRVAYRLDIVSYIFIPSWDWYSKRKITTSNDDKNLN